MAALFHTSSTLSAACRCNDALISCSGVAFPKGDIDERSDERRDQAGPPERVIGTLKEQCVHRQRFEKSVYALRLADE